LTLHQRQDPEHRALSSSSILKSYFSYSRTATSFPTSSKQVATPAMTQHSNGDKDLLAFPRRKPVVVTTMDLHDKLMELSGWKSVDHEKENVTVTVDLILV
jgi:hypothetical protein